MALWTENVFIVTGSLTHLTVPTNFDVLAFVVGMFSCAGGKVLVFKPVLFFVNVRYWVCPP